MNKKTEERFSQENSSAMCFKSKLEPPDELVFCSGKSLDYCRVYLCQITHAAGFRKTSAEMS